MGGKGDVMSLFSKLAKPVWCEKPLNELAGQLGYGRDEKKRKPYSSPLIALFFGLLAGLHAIAAVVLALIAFLSIKSFVGSSAVLLLWSFGCAVSFFVHYGIAQILNCVGRSAHYTEEIADFLRDYKQPDGNGYLLNSILEELRSLNRKTTASEDAQAKHDPEPTPQRTPAARIEIKCPACQLPFSILDLPDAAEHSCPHCGQVVELAEDQ